MSDESAVIKLPAERCMECRFYFMADGICRRFPPHNIVTGKAKDGSVKWMSIFPPMRPDGWCGEFAMIKH